MVTTPSAWGKRLRQLRKDAGLSQPDLAERAHVSHSYISQLETGKKRNPSVDAAEKLAKALDYPLDQWIDETRDKSAPADDADARRQLLKRVLAAGRRLPLRTLEAKVEELEIQAEHYRRESVESQRPAPSR